MVFCVMTSKRGHVTLEALYTRGSTAIAFAEGWAFARRLAKNENTCCAAEYGDKERNLYVYVVERQVGD